MVAVVASTLAVKLVGEILNRKFEVKGRNPPAIESRRRPFWQPGQLATSRRNARFRWRMGEHCLWI